MSDTIELLEAIGRDASLRYASPDMLGEVLEQANASDALTAAVAAGDRSPLAVELGSKVMQVPQATQSPGCEEDPPEDDAAQNDEPKDPPASDNDATSPQR